MSDDKKKNTDEENKTDVSRRSFSFIAATVPAVFALSSSCKPRREGTAALRDVETQARGQEPDSSKFGSVTSTAFGEEGGKDVQGSTRRLGEEGGATTRALGEEGGKTNPVTTQALNEEGDAGPGDEKWGPTHTTQAVGEEGSSEDDYGKIPTITTRALGEEGSSEEPPKHLVTSQALGEEGGKGGAYDRVRQPREQGGFRTYGSMRRGANLQQDEYSSVRPVEGFYQEDGKNNLVTTEAVGEEGAEEYDDVVVTSMALGEEASGGGKDDLYLTTRALHEEGSDENDTDRIKDVNATTLAVGEEGGDWQDPDFDYGRSRMPNQQQALIIVQNIFNELEGHYNLTNWKIETVGTARTNKQVLNITVAWKTMRGTMQSAQEATGNVRVKWVQGWTAQMFEEFARIQIGRNS